MSQDCDNKKEIAKAKFIVGESIQAIADAIGVSRRTIERWANENDGEWRKLRNGNATTNVIQLQPKPKEKLGGTKLPTRRHDAGIGLDDIEVIQSAIADIHASLPSAELGKGSMATALCKLIELKKKLKPESVADLVERAIELGIGPDEFLAELKNAWSKRA